MLLGDADVEGAVRVGLAERQQAHRLQHRGGDRDDVGALGADRDHLLGQHPGPAASAGVDRLAGDGVGDRRDGVQAVGLIIDGRLVAVPLDGDRVHDDRTAEGLGPPQGRLHEGGVVTVDRPDVLQSEVLEQDLRLQEVLDPALEPVQRRVDRAADDGGPGQRCLHGVQGALVALRGAQRRQVVGQPADGRGVGPAVVVDHDDDRVVRRGDVVQGLPAHAAGQRAVADHGHDVPALAAQPVGLGQTVGVGQGRRGVAVLHEVVLGLGSAGVAGQPALLAQRVEAVRAAGDHLVHVRLVAGVPQDLVAGAVEDAVDRQRHLDDAQARAEVPARARDAVDHGVADLGGQQGQLLGSQALEVGGAADAIEQAHGSGPACRGRGRGSPGWEEPGG